MIRFLLALLFTDCAQAQYTVRVVTIRAPELPAARAAMQAASADDGELRRELLPCFAEPVSDHLLRCGPGTSKLSATLETPYATEFDPPDPGWNRVKPSAFGTKNVGTSIEVAIQPDTPDQPRTISVTWVRVRDDGLSEFPLLTAPDTPPIEQPRFKSERITGRIAIVSGRWRLLGMTRPLEATTPPHALLTFVQVFDAGAAQVAAPPSENRLHLCTFRIPATEGMKLATRPAGGDVALLDGLLQRAASGDIVLDGHAACLLQPPVRGAEDAEPPGSADPFTAHQLDAEASSLLEFPYATTWDPDPGAFSVKNTGHRLTFSGTAMEWESFDDPPRMLPISPQPEAAAMLMPEFTGTSLRGPANLPPGTARLAGALLLPEGRGPHVMHLYFLRCAGPAMPSRQEVIECHAAACSLNAKDADRLARRKGDEQRRELEALVESGAARLLAWQTVAGMPGSAASAHHFTETPSPAGSPVGERGAILFPSRIRLHTLGNMLNMNPGEDGAGPAWNFIVSLDRPLLPSPDAFMAALRNGSPLPEFTSVKLKGAIGATALPRQTSIQFEEPVPGSNEGDPRRATWLLHRRNVE